MNAPNCVSTHLTDLIEAMRVFGRNASKHPFGIGYHDGKWWVYVEIDSRLSTFDVETSDKELDLALGTALARIRREARISGATTITTATAAA